MKLLSESISDLLQAADVYYFTAQPDHSEPSESRYLASFNTETCFVSVRIQTDDSDRFCRIEASAGLKVLPESRSHVVRYIGRINHVLKLGQFSINPETGELVIIVDASYEDAAPTLEQWRRMMSVAICVMSEYYVALSEIIYGGRWAVEPSQSQAGPSSEEIDAALSRLMEKPVTNSETAAGESASETPPVKRKRGRPRKHPLPE